MRLKNKVRGEAMVLVSFIFILSLFFTNICSAEDMPESLVDATFSIEFITGTDLFVDIIMMVDKITTDKTYYADDIAVATDDEMGAITYELYLLLTNHLNVIFADASISNFERPVYHNGFFREEFNVKLTSKFFGLNDTIDSDAFVNGVLDMGAVITYNFYLVTELGWNNTYTCVLPQSLDFQSANTKDVSFNKKEITWELSWDGANAEKTSTLSTSLKNPTTVSEKEDIFITFNVDASNVDNISLIANFSIRNIDIQNYNLLPDFVTDLNYVPSDGIRLFINNSLLTWDVLYETTINPIELTTITTIENHSFNQTLPMTFNWDPQTTTNCSNLFNTTEMDSNPAIIAKLTSDNSIPLQICSISPRGFFGLINAGATANISQEDINFGNNLDIIKHPYESFLYLPSSIYIDGLNVYRWNESIPLSGLVDSDVQPLPEYSKENIDTYIEIEIRKMDLNILSFFTGKTELTATAHSKEDHKIHVTLFPDEFSVSKKISLPYLNSDAFRVCVQETVFNEDDIDHYLTNIKDIFEIRLSTVLNGLKIKGVVNKDAFSDSLIWDGDISTMDDVAPVVVSSYANNIYPVSFSLSLWPPDIHLSNQSFMLQSIKNQSVTYRIIFPKGISIKGEDELNKSIIKGKTPNGQEYVEVTLASNEEEITDLITCNLVASPLYILGQFLPCIISFVLVIILIILVFMFRKKRRGKKLVLKNEVETTGYENEDYYVPPPPSSK